MAIVSDSGPILSFARAHHLVLLREVTEELIIPAAVYEEIVGRGVGKPGAAAVQSGAWFKRETVRNRSRVDRLPQHLHLGEREALVLAVERDAALLVDEVQARKAARRLGIPHFGSLFVLKEAKNRGVVPAVKPILDALLSTGTYISDRLYRSFLDSLGED